MGTLQYQLGACEAQAERCIGSKLQVPKYLTFGSGGSNQVIATKVHASLLHLPQESVEGLTPLPDEKEMDNTLNYLSALSVPGKQAMFSSGVSRLLGALVGSDWVFMPGGNAPLGVLGQAGGII